jgi:hypothetical protein
VTRADDAPRTERLERATRRIDEVDAAELVIVRAACGHLPRMGSWSLRALALTSCFLLLGGCGVRTELLEPWQPNALPGDDGGGDASPPVESPDADDAIAIATEETDAGEQLQLGTCAFGDQSIVCVPGDVCHANFVVGPSPFICGPSGDPSTPCGLIACGAGCACADAASSTCRCE